VTVWTKVPSRRVHLAEREVCVRSGKGEVKSGLAAEHGAIGQRTPVPCRRANGAESGSPTRRPCRDLMLCIGLGEAEHGMVEVVPGVRNSG